LETGKSVGINISVVNPDPYVLGLPGPDLSINKQKVRKTLIFTIL
jgi:hypothetical protein